jgi:hypothetical protein
MMVRIDIAKPCPPQITAEAQRQKEPVTGRPAFFFLLRHIDQKCIITLFKNGGFSHEEQFCQDNDCFPCSAEYLFQRMRKEKYIQYGRSLLYL